MFLIFTFSWLFDRRLEEEESHGHLHTLLWCAATDTYSDCERLTSRSGAGRTPSKGSLHRAAGAFLPKWRTYWPLLMPLEVVRMPDVYHSQHFSPRWVGPGSHDMSSAIYMESLCSVQLPLSSHVLPPLHTVDSGRPHALRCASGY